MIIMNNELLLTSGQSWQHRITSSSQASG